MNKRREIWIPIPNRVCLLDTEPLLLSAPQYTAQNRSTYAASSRTRRNATPTLPAQLIMSDITPLRSIVFLGLVPTSALLTSLFLNAIPGPVWVAMATGYGTL